MERRPFNDDVARVTRAYLSALLPPERVTGAWHELVADATYWHVAEQAEVLRLAHQVLLQHERVSLEVAAVTLRELGVPAPHRPQILAVDPDLVAAVDDIALDDLDGPAARPQPLAAAPVVLDLVEDDSAPVDEDADEPSSSDDTPTWDRPPAAADPDERASTVGAALRIGFDDDTPLVVPDDAEPSRRGPSLRTRLALLVLILVIAVVVYLLGPF